MLPEWAIRSGPRKKIYFDPEKVRLLVPIMYMLPQEILGAVQQMLLSVTPCLRLPEQTVFKMVAFAAWQHQASSA